MAANPDQTTLRLTREFDAPRERVYAAVLDAKALQTIWTSDAYPIIDMYVDPRVGGGWRLTMRETASGNVHRCAARYIELAAPSRIVWLTKWLDGPMASAPEMRVTLEFHDLGGRTRLLLTHEFFPDSATRDHHSSGWGAGFDRLALLLAGKL